MDLVQVRILGIVSTGPYGTLQPGDMLRTDAAFARHLVEDCAAAEYITAQANAVPAAPDLKAKRPRKPKEQ